MTKRVCHIFGTSAPAGAGITKIFLSLFRHIDPQRYRLSACFVGAEGVSAEALREKGISVQVIPWRHPSRDVAGALRLIRYLRSNNFDIVHFHWGGPTLRRLVRLVAGAKVILHLHSEIEEVSTRRGVIPTGGCDAVMAVSRSVASVSHHRKTHVIYSGIDFETNASRNNDEEIIGYAGRLTPIKGVRTLIDAVGLLRSDFPNLRLRVAGDGHCRVEFEAHVAAMGLDANVTFLGWIADIATERASWSMMVQPSKEEGLPMSVLEAMAQGVPVVASKVGGIPEMIENGVSGMLVPPGDPESLADVIHRMLRDRHMREGIAEAAKSVVTRKFSAAKMSEEVTSLYDDLLGA